MRQIRPGKLFVTRSTKFVSCVRLRFMHKNPRESCLVLIRDLSGQAFQGTTKINNHEISS
jgi:hypothetical protein